MSVKYQPLLALQASAGSGKTFSLTLHYLFLLFKETYLNPSEILALTFTRKAANEMKHKITHALRLLASDDAVLSENSLKEKYIYLNALKDYGDVSIGEIGDRATKVYKKFLSSKPKIMTLDTFFHIVLRKFCWYVNVPHDFSSQESIDHEILMEDFLQHLDPSLRATLLKLSLQEQWYSLKDSYRFFENLLEKSHECQTLLDAFEETVHFDQSLCFEHAMAFKTMVWDDKAASESAKKAVLFRDVHDLMSKTWLHKDHAHEFKFFKKLDCLPELEPLFDLIKQDVRQYYLASENHILFHIRHIFHVFKQSLQRWQKQHKILSIRDVMLSVHQLLRSRHINTDFLYFRLDAKITHILIDEFQDTDILQFQILEPLIDEILSGYTRKENRSFFYVGDTKQSIYYFRGSNPYLFHDVSDQKNIHWDHLAYNWRSQHEIVDFTNATFSQVYADFIPQIPQKVGGYVKIMTVLEDGLKEQVVQSVKALLQAGVAQEDIALLTFKNSDIVSIADAIKTAMPHVMIVKEGSVYLKNHIEVKSLCYALSYVCKKHRIDKMRFLSLVCDREENDFLDTLECDEPAILIKTIMEKFALFSHSSRKLLELSLEYHDIPSFLDWVENTHEKQPKEKIKGMRILTIHGSKGLEFEHTIVCDRLSKNHAMPEKILFDYDRMDVRKIFTYKRHREHFDPDYKRAKEQEQKHKEQEHLNLLYVAFTRAKNSLHVIQKAKNSSFDILKLKDCVNGNLIVHVKHIQEEQIVSMKAIKQKDLGRQTEFLKKESAHHLKDVSKRSIEKGRAIHLAFELFLKYQMSEEEVFALLYNRWGYLFDTQTIRFFVKKCINILKNPLFLDFLSKGKVECEVSFLDGDCVRRIDLIIIGEDEVYIIDYKSGDPDKEDYIKQIQSYKRIASEHYRRPAKGYLLTMDGAFVTID